MSDSATGATEISETAKTCQLREDEAQPTLFRAAMVADAAGAVHRPGALLVDKSWIIACGPPQQVSIGRDVRIVDLPDRVLIPALVNAHCHLDLTHIGPQPHEGGFTRFAALVRSERCLDDAAIAKSVRLGIELSRIGGTAAVGDIAGARSLVPAHIMRSERMHGVSYVEVFGLAKRQEAAIAFMRALDESEPVEADGVKLGFQPHAPYSCGSAVYEAAVKLGRPVATHLAESLEELMFVEAGSGPIADLLKSIGVWDESLVGVGAHPVDALYEFLKQRPIVAAHLNYLEQRHIEMLARTPITAAYCPRASAYFGHPQAGHSPHRYRELIQAGVNVALGTDSIICLDTPDRLSVLDDMRFLFARDAADPLALLAMATVNGTAALGLERNHFTFRSGASCGILALTIDPTSSVDPLRQALARTEPPQWIVDPSTSGDVQR